MGYEIAVARLSLFLAGLWLAVVAQGIQLHEGVESLDVPLVMALEVEEGGHPGSKSQIYGLLDKHFTSGMWSKWNAKADEQKLSAETNAAVLNSYLCENVENDTKVVHVINWVKHSLRQQRELGSAQGNSAQIAQLKSRLKDAELLAQQTHSSAAAKLLAQSKADLQVAEDRLGQGELAESKKSGKVAKLKHIAVAKKKKAQELGAKVKLNAVKKKKLSAKKVAKAKHKLKKSAKKTKKKA